MEDVIADGGDGNGGIGGRWGCDDNSDTCFWF
jgi:hypothetical protein